MNMLALAESLRRLCGHRFPPLGGWAFRQLFRALPPTAEVELLPGVRARLDFQDDTMRGTYWQGERFEFPTAHILRDWARGGATHFFDIGSNYGFFTWWLLSQVPGLQVHAFEPNPRTFAKVEEIRVANGFDRLQVWNLGLSDAPGRLALHAGVTDSGHSTFGEHPELKGPAIAEVEVLPFSAWLERAGLALPARPSWIAKIDVEGFETRVLQGLAPALRARAFLGLVVESNAYTLEFCGSSLEEMRSVLHDCGYRARPLAGNGSGNEFFAPVA